MGQILHGSATMSDNTSRRDNIGKRRKRRYGPEADISSGPLSTPAVIIGRQSRHAAQTSRAASPPPQHEGQWKKTLTQLSLILTRFAARCVEGCEGVQAVLESRGSNETKLG